MEGAPTQILLLANDLLGESLALQLQLEEPKFEIALKSDQLNKHPSLIIWSIESLDMPNTIQLEVRQLQEHWKPSPLLLLLPPRNRTTSSEILQFDCSGLLQDPDLKTLISAIQTLLEGGRVVRLKDKQNSKINSHVSHPIGLGQWLLISGLQQINQDLLVIENTKINEQNLLLGLIVQGRKRELLGAKSLLLFLWGQSKSRTTQDNNIQSHDSKKLIGYYSSNYKNQLQGETNISLSDKRPETVWANVYQRLNEIIENGFVNETGKILSIEGLNSTHQQSLLLALMSQVNQVIERLRNSIEESTPVEQKWASLQQELRKQALLSMVGNYVRISQNGESLAVGERLIEMTDLNQSDNDLPNPKGILNALLLDQPVLCEGQLLPVDDPRSIIQIEMHLTNWLIRTSEMISSEVLEACGEWPELRQILLKDNLISTRELERLRNQLNSQNRWLELVQRPIQLYESKRLFYKLDNGSIIPVEVTEPRDEELRQLSWIQQQIALLIETRDALSPQVQALAKRLGDLLAVILTQVIGRAIGLIGRGIAQGMGRSLGRN